MFHFKPPERQVFRRCGHAAGVAVPAISAPCNISSGLAQEVLEADHTNNRLMYRIGGVCGLVFGIAYVIIIVLYAPIGAPPYGVDARLVYLAAHTTRWQGIIGLSVLTDFLLVPFTFSIYFALRKVNHYFMLLAAAFMILFVVLDLTITWTNYASLMTLSGKYAKAVTEIQKAVILTASEPACAVLQSSLLFVYNTLTLAIGILISGLLMVRNGFSKTAAYLGIATGCVGIISVVGSFFTSALGFAIILASSLTTLWAIVVGRRLYAHDGSSRHSVRVED